MNVQPELARPQIGFGRIAHRRSGPRAHAFSYGGCCWLLPMRALASQPEPLLRRNARGWMSFHDRDHGQGGPDALAWLQDLLAQEGLWPSTSSGTEVWLQTFPRVWGHAFKPVSFWYVCRADGGLHAVVAEVNSTFGQRHAYVLHGPGVAWGRTLHAPKAMHVSPFCSPQGAYQFRFAREGSQLRASVQVMQDDASVLQTSISADLQAMNGHSLRRAQWGWPLLSLGVVLRIHWQALRLWLAGNPVYHLPEGQGPGRISHSLHLQPTQDSPVARRGGASLATTTPACAGDFQPMDVSYLP